MAKLAPQYENLKVKMSQIRDNAKNARQVPKDGTKEREEYDKAIKDLADDIKVNGLVDPLAVIRTNSPTKPYEIRTGSRRYAAATLLEWEEIDVRVIPFKDDVDLELVGLAHNLDRSDLTTYEIAMKLAEIKRDFPTLSDAILATRVGRSKSYVQNMLRLVSSLHPKIIIQWANGHGLATTDNLLKLAKEENKDEQWKRWQVLCGITTATDGETNGAPESQTDQPIKRNAKKAATSLLEAITADKELAKKNVFAIQALQYVINARKTPPAGVSLAKPSEAAASAS